MFRVKPTESDLSSRKCASEVREQVEDAITAGKAVVFDYSDVATVSESYADEIFGVLAWRHGLDWLLAGVKIVSAPPSVLKSVAQAVDRRLIEVERQASSG